MTVATLRQLPSGNWQASVLLDDGSRTTSTHPTPDEAAAWAARTEAERDTRRAAKAARRHKEGVDLVLAELSDLIQNDSLDRAQWRRLRRLVADGNRGEIA